MLSRDGEKGWTFDDTRGLRFRDRVFVPVACRENVLKEFHHSRFAVHPGVQRCIMICVANIGGKV